MQVLAEPNNTSGTLPLLPANGFDYEWEGPLTWRIVAIAVLTAPAPLWLYYCNQDCQMH